MTTCPAPECVDPGCTGECGHRGRKPTTNLPAHAEFITGTTSIPLSQAPTSALAFALGYAAARPVSASQFAPFCAMIEELSRRDSTGGLATGPLGTWDQATELGQLMALLPGELARSLSLLYQAQRGQRWAHTGRRTSENRQSRASD